MDQYSGTVCPDCEDEELMQIEGDWLCPDCDSVFALVPGREEFAL